MTGRGAGGGLGPRVGGGKGEGSRGGLRRTQPVEARTDSTHPGASESYIPVQAQEGAPLNHPCTGR